MSEPCACPPEPPIAARPAPSGDAERIGRHFDQRFQDWEPVGPEASDKLFGWLQAEGLAGSTVLDVGCGSGEFLVRALEAGAAGATGADLSSEAIALASELVHEAGFEDRTDLWVGDAAVEALDSHDVVVLDKVICCYPDADALIAHSAAAAQRLFALVIPESRGFWGLVSRIRWLVLGIPEWISGEDWPRFVHDRLDVEAKVLAAGFRPVHTGRQYVWFVGVYARR